MDAIRIILASIKRADRDFNLINNGDKIAIGISGGKDSMLLLYALNLYKKFSKINFTIIPIHINLGFPNSCKEELKKYVESLGLELVIADGSTVFEILKEQQKLQKTPHLPCSICSKMKKAIINKEAKKYSCNKVSFAHHASDAIETLFLNEIYGGRIATFSPKMFLEKEEITFIRPLIYIHESVIKRGVNELNIPVFKSGCPNDGYTKREDIKNILNSLYKEFPSAKDNFLTMLMNDSKIDLFYTYKERKIFNTDLYYKKVNDINSIVQESKYINNALNEFYLKECVHLNLYKNNELSGIAILKEEERTLKIFEIWVKEKSMFIPFVFDIYKTSYDLINPMNLIIYNSKEYHDELIKMRCKFDKENEIYSIENENPRHLDSVFKKERLYQ